MTRFRLLSIVAGALAGAVVVFGILLVIALSRINTATSKLETAQGELQSSQKASTQTRITTVTQRCELTSEIKALATLDRNVLLRFVPPRFGQAIVVAPYNKHLALLTMKYEGCEKQLALVIKINKETKSGAGSSTSSP